jgi:hypothetical protein
MIRTESLVLGCVLLVLALTIAPAVRADPPATQPVGVVGSSEPANPTNAETARALARRMPMLQFDGIAFDDTIDFLRDITGTNIFVDWTTLTKANIARDKKMTVGKLQDIPYGQALTLALDNVAGKGKLGWSLENGVITISTTDALAKGVVTRVYDVHFVRDNQPAAAPATQPAADPLFGLIRGSIAPDSWGEKGPSSISEVHGLLIITAPAENQKLIGNLLENLKKLLKSDTPDAD